MYEKMQMVPFDTNDIGNHLFPAGLLLACRTSEGIMADILSDHDFDGTFLLHNDECND